MFCQPNFRGVRKHIKLPPEIPPHGFEPISNHTPNYIRRVSWPYGITTRNTSRGLATIGNLLQKQLCSVLWPFVIITKNMSKGLMASGNYSQNNCKWFVAIIKYPPKMSPMVLSPFQITPTPPNYLRRGLRPYVITPSKHFHVFCGHRQLPPEMPLGGSWPLAIIRQNISRGFGATCNYPPKYPLGFRGHL